MPSGQRLLHAKESRQDLLVSATTEGHAEGLEAATVTARKAEA